MTGWRQERGEREEQQIPARAIHTEQLECRAQLCLGKFLLETGLFHLVQPCKDMEGYRSEGHSPLLAKQSLCMLRSSQGSYLGRLMESSHLAFESSAKDPLLLA